MYLLLGAPRSRPSMPSFLIEHLQTTTRDVIPTYCAIRSETHKYVRYVTGEQELYDLTVDPYELQSRHADPRFADLKAKLHAELVDQCSPPPPGLTL